MWNEPRYTIDEVLKALSKAQGLVADARQQMPGFVYVEPRIIKLLEALPQSKRVTLSTLRTLYDLVMLA